MRTLTMFATAALLTAPFAYPQEPVSSKLRTVEEFISAFNSHNSAAMADLVANDIAWLSVTGEEVAVVVKGKQELVASMNDYFQSCPSCQSELSGTLSTPGRVSAVEIARWQGESGSNSQRSISVYEFSNGLIQRVYYFPSEK